MLARGFSLKDETIEVKEIMEGQLPVLEKVDLVYTKYNALVRYYKRLERRITESQKKQLEVRIIIIVSVPCTHSIGHATSCL